MASPRIVPTGVLGGQKGDKGDRGVVGPSGGPFPDLTGVTSGKVPQTTGGGGVEFVDLSASTVALVAEPATSPVTPTDPYGGNEALSADYLITVNGVPQFVHVARVQDDPFSPATVGADFGGDYAFLGFDAPTGFTTQVEIFSIDFNLAGTEVVTRRPEAISSLRRRSNHISLTLTGPAKIVLMPNGNRHPLMLFGDPVEASINPADSNVLYYGPGYHVVGGSGVLTVPAGKTLYLHRNAVLKGTVLVTGAGVTIRGRGIISGDHLLRDPVNGTPLIDNRGAGTTVNGPSLRGSATWALPTWKGATAATITNVKLLSSRLQNDDAISFINAPGSRASDCFVRSDDDCLCVKGSDDTRAAGDVRFTDMTLWCDRARVILIGHESHATSMADIQVTDVLVVYSPPAALPNSATYPAVLVQPGDGLLVSNLLLADIDFRGVSQPKLIQLTTDPTGGVTTTPGKITGATVERITVDGSGGRYVTELHGSDSTHTVANVAISEMVINGEPVTSSASPYISVGAFTSGITVTES